MHQDDQAYAPAGWQFGDSKLGVSFLRLRTVAAGTTSPSSSRRRTTRHAWSTRRKSPTARPCTRPRCHMGYQPTVRIIKARRTARIGGCSLCIDEVEGVGGFIEAERMAPDNANAQTVQAELAALIESLGVCDNPHHRSVRLPGARGTPRLIYSGVSH